MAGKLTSRSVLDRVGSRHNERFHTQGPLRDKFAGLAVANGTSSFGFRGRRARQLGTAVLYGTQWVGREASFADVYHLPLTELPRH